MKKPDEERIRKIISIWAKVQEQIRQKEITKEKLLSDPFLQWAMTTPLYNIGEQVYQISTEFKKKHADVPGVRSRVCGTDWYMIMRGLTGSS